MNANRPVALLLGILATTSTPASAAPAFAPLAAGVVHVAPVVLSNAGNTSPGFVAINTNGTFGYWSYDGAGWTAVAMPGDATSSVGISAVFDPTDGGYYAFAVDAHGLRETRSLDDGRTWAAWCTIDTRATIESAASVVYLGKNVGFRAFAKVNEGIYGDHLVMWTIDPANGFCQSHTASEPGGNADGPPVVVSWGGTRADVFVVDGDSLDHLWADDGNTFYFENFDIPATGAATLEPDALAVSAPLSGALDVLLYTWTAAYYAEGSSQLQELGQVVRFYYRSGWHTEIAASGAYDKHTALASVPVEAEECNLELGVCDEQAASDFTAYLTQGSTAFSESRAMFGDGTLGAQATSTAAPSFTEVHPATMTATGRQVLLGTDGQTLYWTPGNDGL